MHVEIITSHAPSFLYSPDTERKNILCQHTTHTLQTLRQMICEALKYVCYCPDFLYGRCILNGRGSDQSKRAISIPVFLNTRKSNFAMCDYTRARAQSTPLRSFAIMHSFTSCSHSTCRNVSVVSDGVSLSICIAFCILFKINIMVQDGI